MNIHEHMSLDEFREHILKVFANNFIENDEFINSKEALLFGLMTIMSNCVEAEMGLESSLKVDEIIRVMRETQAIASLVHTALGLIYE